MAQWQVLKSGMPINAPIFDDGAPGQAGDPGFSSNAVAVHVASLGAAVADGFNYVGPSPAAQ